MSCRSCGAEIDADANFCHLCGRSTQAAGAPTERISDPAQTTRVGQEQRPAPTTRMRPQEDPPARTGRGAEASTRGETSPRAGMRECPECGAANGPHRLICGRCGVDLETGTRRQPRPPRADASSEGPEEEPGARRGLAAVIVLAALVGIIVGGVTWLRLAPDDTPPPAFDPAVYAADPTPLPVVVVTASSTRDPEGPRSYAAGNVADGDLATAWAPAADDEDATLTIRLGQLSWVRSIAVWSGDQTTETSFVERGRPAVLFVTVDDGRVYEITLHDIEGRQAVTLPEPVLGRTVRVTIASAVAGSAATEPALSGLVLEGWEARGADRDRR